MNDAHVPNTPNNIYVLKCLSMLELFVTSSHKWRKHHSLGQRIRIFIKKVPDRNNDVLTKGYILNFFISFCRPFENRYRYIWTCLLVSGPDKQQILRHENTDDGRCHSIETSGTRQK